MMGYQAAFLCSRHRSQLWLKENQRWVRAGGYPRGRGVVGAGPGPRKAEPGQLGGGQGAGTGGPACPDTLLESLSCHYMGVFYFYFFLIYLY